MRPEEANYLNPGYFEQGVGKLLTNGEADIAVGYYFLTTTRVQIASPLMPLISEAYVCNDRNIACQLSFLNFLGFLFLLEPTPTTFIKSQNQTSTCSPFLQRLWQDA